MRIKADRAELLGAVEKACRAADAGSAVTAFQMCLLEADEGLTISASNGALWVRANVTVEVIEPGACAVNVSRLRAALATGGDTVEIAEKDGRARVTSGGGRYHLPALQGSSVPAFRQSEGEAHEIPTADFLSALSRVSKAADSGHAEPFCRAVYAHESEDGLALVATNKLILIRSEVDCPAFTALLPATLGSTLNGVLEKDAPVTVAVSDTLATFRQANVSVTTKLVDVDYPAYERITSVPMVASVFVPKAALLSIAAALAPFGAEDKSGNSIHLRASGETLTVAAQSVHESGVHTIPADVQGDFPDICLVAAQLRTILQSLDCEEVEICTGAGGNPCFVKAPNLPDELRFIAPVARPFPTLEAE